MELGNVKVIITLLLCFIFILFNTSCNHSARETPVYVKFGRPGVWQSWIAKSGQINLPVSNLPFTPDYPGNEVPCSYRNIRGGIASHHLLIAPVLMAYYKVLSEIKPDITTFFIIGPDHFRLSKAHIAVGTDPFYWRNKIVGINEKAVSGLIRTLKIQKDSAPFKGEHSIVCHIPFIASFFPGADIVPVIIDNDCLQKVCRQVSDYINNYIKNNRNCFFLLSIDFSHNLDRNETERRDTISLKVLKKMDPVFSRSITCDSLQSWYIFTNTFSENLSCMDIQYYTTNENYLGKNASDITSYFFTFLRTVW